MSPLSEDYRRDRKDLRLGIITVSSSRTAAAKDGRDIEDESGDRACAMVGEHGFRVTFRRLVGDDMTDIRMAFTEGLATTLVDALIFIGGTGASSADVTPEAVEPMLKKELPGFGELFRQRSSEKVGAASVLSRALAGTVDGVAVFCLPGSPDGCELGMEIALEILPHLKALLGPS
ncbi:MAG: MogA/MoaB family molybdenum cofactor biosynthesis protein [Conexivisphaerales archaeon]|jgi:molybdenum cofactor biosynthesis protein B